jgi:hypothetical protein
MMPAAGLDGSRRGGDASSDVWSITCFAVY